ncbi:porin [Litorisediminicola beolgyonensis]|uniref:Porin n=1 Tax=Litorisediminicola beolgyonensis TaxID=1173614 RepID=A0ABW3ZD49_9RHOB
MKKLLLASTALVATAGFASAEVTTTGWAEMGIFGGSSDLGDTDTQFFTDIEVTFTMTGETDTGISFGAALDMEDGVGTGGGAVNNNADDGGASMFVSFGGATLTMGNTDGAYDAAVPEMALAGGSIADDETAHAGFNDGSALSGEAVALLGGLGVALPASSRVDGREDGQIARFDYTVSSFGFHLSAEQDGDGAGDEPVIGVGFTYGGEFGGATVNAGIAHQKQDEWSVTGFGITGTMASGFSAGITYSQVDFSDADDDEIDHVGIGIGYEMNALAIGFNYGKWDAEGAEASGYGLAAAYDLGGGLVFQAGYGNSNADVDGVGEADSDSFSMGLRMNF